MFVTNAKLQLYAYDRTIEDYEAELAELLKHPILHSRKIKRLIKELKLAKKFRTIYTKTP